LRGWMKPENVIAISATPFDEPHPQSWVLPQTDGLPDAFVAVAFVVIAQLLALSFSLELGLTPDNPFPGGGVNRVVRGVRIHPLEL
jgi:tagatose-6-phosphate ketose/aldose isomerase